MLVVGRKSSAIRAGVWEPQQCVHWHRGEENKKPKAFWVVFFNTLHTSLESVLRAHCDQKGNTAYGGQNDQRDHLFACVYASKVARPHRRISTQQNWLEYVCYSLAAFSRICAWLVREEARRRGGEKSDQSQSLRSVLTMLLWRCAVGSGVGSLRWYTRVKVGGRSMFEIEKQALCVGQRSFKES